VTFAKNPIVDYESFKSQQDGELCDLAWLYNMNRGVFSTPGRDEEWTLSVGMTNADVDHYLGVFEEFASELTR
jgi:glutamate-1-semialdehyde 2,1-aminomutase